MNNQTIFSLVGAYAGEALFEQSQNFQLNPALISVFMGMPFPRARGLSG